MASALRMEFAVVTIAQKRVVMGIRFNVNVAAVSAVAAGRAAAWDVLLSAERDAAVPAVAGFYRNFGFVCKHGLLAMKEMLREHTPMLSP